MGEAGLGAIVLGLSPTGLYTARELADLGVPVLGVARTWQCGIASRALTHSERYWKVEGDEDLLGRLQRLPELDSRTYVLIPTDDHSIEFLGEYGPALGESVRFQSSYTSGAAHLLLDKNRFRGVCEAAGVPAPRALVGAAPRLSELSRSLDFPLLVKPATIHRVMAFMRGQKVFVCHSHPELDELVSRLPEGSTEWLLQELVPGPESEIVMAAGFRSEAGELLDLLTARKLRQYPPCFGSASRVFVEPIPEIIEPTSRLLGAAGYSGVFAAEFKRDPRTGRFKVLEINARPSLWFGVCRRAGVRIVERAFREMAGLPSERSARPLAEGVLWRYGVKDVASALYYLCRGPGAPLPPPATDPPAAVRHRAWAVLEGWDPAPVASELLTYAIKAFERRPGS